MFHPVSLARRRPCRLLPAGNPVRDARTTTTGSRQPKNIRSKGMRSTRMTYRVYGVLAAHLRGEIGEAVRSVAPQERPRQQCSQRAPQNALPLTWTAVFRSVPPYYSLIKMKRVPSLEDD